MVAKRIAIERLEMGVWQRFQRSKRKCYVVELFVRDVVKLNEQNENNVPQSVSDSPPPPLAVGAGVGAGIGEGVGGQVSSPQPHVIVPAHTELLLFSNTEDKLCQLQ